MSDANRVILLTGPGTSAIAVVRIYGPLVGSFLQTHFTRKLRVGAAVHGRLTDGDREIDDPVVVWDEVNQSADICVHGGSWVVHQTIELSCRFGFTEIRHTAPPLPAEAFQTNDPIEREILQFLPSARTKEAIQTLLNQREAWVKLLASPATHDLKAILRDASLEHLLNPPRITIIGIPNAGKSSLANALFGQQRSIVSPEPGTTRDYVSEPANLGGLAVILLDTPGLRVSSDKLEMAAIDLSENQIRTADLQILLLDPTQPETPQREMRIRFPDALVVYSKADLQSIPGELSISDMTGQGLPSIEAAIRARFHCQLIPHQRPCAWTQRQRELLTDLLALTSSSAP